MTAVFDNIFVGNDEDYQSVASKKNFSFLHCAKYPYHKELVGYEKKVSPIDREYLYAHRGHKLALNMVDANNPALFKKVQFQYAYLFIKSEVAKKRTVLINCNKGESRSPSVALFYLAHLGVVKNDTFSIARTDFLDIYPNYKPSYGISLYMHFAWESLMEHIQ